MIAIYSEIIDYRDYMFVVKVKKIRIVKEINDVSIEVECYLTCPDGAIYKNSSGGDIKNFKVRVSRSMLSDVVSFEEKLIETASQVIYQDFHVSAQVVSPQYREYFSEFGIEGTSVLMLREDDVKKICVGMTLVGPGYNLGISPFVESITKKKEIVVSQNLRFIVEACTVDPKIRIDANLVSGSSSVSITPWAQSNVYVSGLSVSGEGIPPNTLVKQFDQTTWTLFLTQKALATGSSIITISKDPNSIYLNVSELIMDDRYVGLSVLGKGIKDGTKTSIVDVSQDSFQYSPLGVFNCVKLSDYVVTGTTDITNYCFGITPPVECETQTNNDDFIWISTARFYCDRYGTAASFEFTIPGNLESFTFSLAYDPFPEPTTPSWITTPTPYVPTTGTAAHASSSIMENLDSLPDLHRPSGPYFNNPLAYIGENPNDVGVTYTTDFLKVNLNQFYGVLKYIFITVSNTNINSLFNDNMGPLTWEVIDGNDGVTVLSSGTVNPIVITNLITCDFGILLGDPEHNIPLNITWDAAAHNNGFVKITNPSGNILSYVRTAFSYSFDSRAYVWQTHTPHVFVELNDFTTDVLLASSVKTEITTDLPTLSDTGLENTSVILPFTPPLAVTMGTKVWVRLKLDTDIMFGQLYAYQAFEHSTHLPYWIATICP